MCSLQAGAGREYSHVMLWVLPGGGVLKDGRQPPAQSNVKILENWVENRI